MKVSIELPDPVVPDGFRFEYIGISLKELVDVEHGYVFLRPGDKNWQTIQSPPRYGFEPAPEFHFGRLVPEEITPEISPDDPVHEQYCKATEFLESMKSLKHENTLYETAGARVKILRHTDSNLSPSIRRWMAFNTSQPVCVVFDIGCYRFPVYNTKGSKV